MEIMDYISLGWGKTCEDFRNASKNGDAWLWTEDTLRLSFIRHLNEVSKLGRVLAETRFHVGSNDYLPDIVADVLVNDSSKTVVFELKFFGNIDDWKNDLKKLDEYSTIGWDAGYFLAIGLPAQCKEIKKAPPVKSFAHYDIQILAEEFSRSTSIPNFVFAEILLKDLLGKETPYIVNEINGAYAFLGENTIAFDMVSKADKITVYAIFNESVAEEKLKELSETFVKFDEEGELHYTEDLTRTLLIGEFDCPQSATVGKMAQEMREKVIQFKQKMDLI